MSEPSHLDSVIEVLASRYSLGLMTSDHVAAAAKDLLHRGSDSQALVEIALDSRPELAEVGPLFEKFLRERGVVAPAPDRALGIVLSDLMRRISDGTIDPREGARRIVNDLVRHPSLAGRNEKYVGDALGVQELVGLYYEIDEVEERPEDWEGERGAATISRLTEGLRTFARRWLASSLKDPARRDR